MILTLPPQVYRCALCHSTDVDHHHEPPIIPNVVYSEVWHCRQCGHETRIYRPSLTEQEMGEGHVYAASHEMEF